MERLELRPIGGHVNQPVPAETQPRKWLKLGTRHRIRAAALSGSLIAVFIIAALLTPDARGLGTHEQLGFGACPSLTFFHIPCAFCGMTTTFALMVRGHLIAGFLTQPAGAVLFMGAAFACSVSLAMVVAGRTPSWAGTGIFNKRFFLTGAGVIVGSWIYKVITFLN